MRKVLQGIVLFLLTLTVLTALFFLHVHLVLSDQKTISPLALHVPSPTPTPTPTPTPIPTDTPTPTPTSTPIPTASPFSDSVWDSLAGCESNGNWAEDTGNGYYGGLQFNQTAWESVGGTGKASSASREDQIAKGKLLQQARGWGVWANCASKLGLY